MIINCPNCRLRGENKNLGEILADGFRIIRSIGGTIDYTVIKAKEYTVSCGNCGMDVISTQPVINRSNFNVLVAFGTIYQYYAKNSYIG